MDKKSFYMVKIGKFTLEKPYILAPLSGVSDLPFRLVSREAGCAFAFTEMISGRSLCYKSNEAQIILKSCAADQPLGIQLLTHEPDIIARAIDCLAGYKFDILDLNAACPVKKVIRSGAGSGLMRQPDKLKELLTSMVARSTVPVTVKIRAGWDSSSINAVEIAKLAQDCGVAAVSVHGRTRKQGYSGAVDYDIIAKVKKSLTIPVIASGDILSGRLTKRMFDETGCDVVMVARGATGNPWIFKEIEEFCRTGILPERPALEVVAGIMERHLGMNVELYGEARGVLHFRKFFGWYTKGFSRVRPLRMRAFLAKTKQEMDGFIGEFRSSGCEHMASIQG